ncbi:unnamed protein product, partial [marine sediment metagenome]
EDMQQTLALLTGYGDNARKLLKASESGILYTVNPRIKSIWGFKGLNDTTHKQGDNIPCNEVMITGHAENTGIIWVRPYAQYDPTPVTGNFAWPVAANAVVGFVVSNLNQLWFYYEKKDDIVIVAYTI